MAISHAFSQVSSNWTGTVTVYDTLGNQVSAAASNLVQPTDWNSAHSEIYGLAGNSNVIGNTAAVGSNVFFCASGNMSISGTSNSMVFNTPAQVMENMTMFGLPDGGMYSAYQSFFLPTPHSALAAPLCFCSGGSFDYVRFPSGWGANLFGGGGSAGPFGTTANTSLGFSCATTFNLGLYQLQHGAASNSVTQVSSGSCAMQQSNSFTSDPTGSQWSFFLTASFAQGSNTNSYTTSSSGASASYTMNGTQMFTAWLQLQPSAAGLRWINFPTLTGNVGEGPLWYMLGLTTASQTFGVNALDMSLLSGSLSGIAGYPQGNSSYWRDFGNSSSYGGPWLGNGIYSGSTNGALPAQFDLFTDIVLTTGSTFPYCVPQFYRAQSGY